MGTRVMSTSSEVGLGVQGCHLLTRVSGLKSRSDGLESCSGRLSGCSGRLESCFAWGRVCWCLSKLGLAGMVGTLNCNGLSRAFCVLRGLM